MLVLELLLLCDSPHLDESVFGIGCIQSSGICCCVAVSLLGVSQKIKKPKNKTKKNCVCTFPGPVFCIIVSASTCMIMEFKLVDGVQFFLVLSVLVALPPLW